MDLPALRRRYADLRRSCGLEPREFERQCRTVFCMNSKVNDPAEPEHWVAAAEIVAMGERFPNWPRHLPYPCCADVELFNCVCTMAYYCERHGERHMGSHD